MMLRERMILESRSGPRELLAKERRLAQRAESVGTNAAILAIASAVMFLVVLGVTRDLAVAAIAGSPAVVALAFSLWALATWIRLAAVRRWVAAPSDLGDGNSGTGVIDGRSMDRAVM
jgi:hypothetical protein